jgi:hypothetical protein
LERREEVGECQLCGRRMKLQKVVVQTWRGREEYMLCPWCAEEVRQRSRPL